MERIIGHAMKLLLIAALVSFLGCGSTEKTGRFTSQQIADYQNEVAQPLPPVSGGLALAVGAEAIKAEDIVLSVEPELSEMARNMTYADFYQWAYPIIGRKIVNEATGRLLYERAKRDAGDKLDDQLKKLVEADIVKFLTTYGNDYAAAEKALRERGIISWKEYRKLKKREILLGVYYQKQMKEYEASVSNEQMLEYYNANKGKYQSEGVMEFMLIDIVPGKLPAKQDDSGNEKSAEDEALLLAVELVEKLRNGEDFREIAKEHSHGVYAAKGGVWTPRRPGNLAKPYDVLEDEFKKMQQGGISEPIEIEGHVFIAKLVKYQTQSVKPFYEVRNEIEEIISFEKRKKYVSEISSEEVDVTTIPHIDEFIGTCVSQAYKIFKISRQ